MRSGCVCSVCVAWSIGQHPLPREVSLQKEVRQSIGAGRSRKGRAGVEVVRAMCRAVCGRGLSVVLGCVARGLSGVPCAAAWGMLVW